MDLFGKVTLVVLLLILVFGVWFVVTQQNVNTNLTQAQAVQFVLNDLKAANPTANITLINVSASILKANSWSITLSIVYNATKPCPTLFIEAFDYPATGLVPSVDNLYTRKCIIYGLSNAPSYVISSPYIAIARSYNQSPQSLKSYVQTYGYNNTKVYAKFLTNLTLDKPYYNVWFIQYNATGAPYSQYLLLNSSGSVIKNFTSLKQTSVLTTYCVPGNGYLCQAPAIATSGTLSFNFGQSTGVTIYNIELACTANSTTSGGPNPPSAWMYITGTGSATYSQSAGTTALVSGQTITVSGLQCYNSAGLPLSNIPSGTQFTGYIWLNYTSNSGVPGPGNKQVTVRVGPVGAQAR